MNCFDFKDFMVVSLAPPSGQIISTQFTLISECNQYSIFLQTGCYDFILYSTYPALLENFGYCSKSYPMK